MGSPPPKQLLWPLVCSFPTKVWSNSKSSQLGLLFFPVRGMGHRTFSPHVGLCTALYALKTNSLLPTWACYCVIQDPSQSFIFVLTSLPWNPCRSLHYLLQFLLHPVFQGLLQEPLLSLWFLLSSLSWVPARVFAGSLLAFPLYWTLLLAFREASYPSLGLMRWWLISHRLHHFPFKGDRLTCNNYFVKFWKSTFCACNCMPTLHI